MFNDKIDELPQKPMIRMDIYKKREVMSHELRLISMKDDCGSIS